MDNFKKSGIKFKKGIEAAFNDIVNHPPQEYFEEDSSDENVQCTSDNSSILMMKDDEI